MPHSSTTSKKNKSEQNQLALGNNFYCTISFEGLAYPEFTEDVIISYENEKTKDNSFKCILTSGADYKKKERVRGGEYKLANVECPGHIIVGLPETLDVKGYTMNIKFDIKKES